MIQLRHILLGILTYALLTLWIPERWALSSVEASIFACSTIRLLGVVSGRRQASFDPIPFLFATICFWGVLQLALGWTVLESATVDAALYWMAAACFAWLGLEACSTSPDRRLFLKEALAVGSGVCILGIVQLFTSDGKAFWLFDTGYKTLVVGPFVNRNHFAAFVELLLPVALIFALEDRRYSKTYIGVAAALVASVIASASRAGTVIVVVELVLVFLLRRKVASERRMWFTLALMAGVLCVVLGYQILFDRLRDDRDPFHIRREFLFSSLAMVRAQPYHGFGLGSWPWAYREFATIDTGLVANHAHNEWIQWAAEGGLPVLALMIAVFAICLRAAVRSVWGIGVIAVFMHALVDYPLLRLGLGAWTFVFIGVLGAYTRERLGARRPGRDLSLTPLRSRACAGLSIPLMAFGVFLSVKLAWADSLYRSASLAGVERAAVLVPNNPDYHFALASFEPGRAVSELERTLALNPFLTKARIELADELESQGQLKLAETTLLEGARRDRQFAPAWAMANFYARNDRADHFWPWARRAVEISYGDLGPLFDLCFLVTDSPLVVDDLAIAPNRAVERQFLGYLIRTRLASAQPIARRLAAHATADDRPTLLDFIDQSLAGGQFAAAVEICNAISRAQLLPYRTMTGVDVVNGDFAQPILNRGFDWRMPEVGGVSIAQSFGSPSELGVALSGRQPETCELLTQFVPLQKAGNYVLRFEYRTSELPEHTGLAWSLGPEQSLLLSSSEQWAPIEWQFVSTGGTERLVLAYSRIPGTVRTEGSLALRRVRIDIQ